MPSRSASASTKANIAPKAVRAASPKPGAKATKMSKLEAERLASFKALMKKYRSKATFAGYDA